jgi:hypothetical protein
MYRDSCVLSIEVTLLLQSNSEEIERISFVQHDKRKAMESKASIQPFATEEEAGSQQAGQLMRNDGVERNLFVQSPHCCFVTIA